MNAPVLGVVPPIAPGAGNDVTLADPLNELPPMVREVVSVAADPVVDWLSVGNVQLVRVPLAGVPSAGVVRIGLVSVLLESV